MKLIFLKIASPAKPARNDRIGDSIFVSPILYTSFIGKKNE